MHRSYSCFASYTRGTDCIPSLTTAASRLFVACGLSFFFCGPTRCQDMPSLFGAGSLLHDWWHVRRERKGCEAGCSRCWQVSGYERNEAEESSRLVSGRSHRTIEGRRTWHAMFQRISWTDGVLFPVSWWTKRAEPERDHVFEDGTPSSRSERWCGGVDCLEKDRTHWGLRSTARSYDLSREYMTSETSKANHWN